MSLVTMSPREISTNADCSPIEPRIRLMEIIFVLSSMFGETTAGSPWRGTSTAVPTDENNRYEAYMNIIFPVIFMPRKFINMTIVHIAYGILAHSRYGRIFPILERVLSTITPIIGSFTPSQILAIRNIVPT